MSEWKLVPTRPTEAMLQAAHHWQRKEWVYADGKSMLFYDELYRAMLAAAPAAVPGVGEREAFEAWAKVWNLPVWTDPIDHSTYEQYQVRLAWSAWQARAALSAAPPVVPGEEKA